MRRRGGCRYGQTGGVGLPQLPGERQAPPAAPVEALPCLSWCLEAPSPRVRSRHREPPPARTAPPALPSPFCASELDRCRRLWSAGTRAQPISPPDVAGG